MGRGDQRVGERSSVCCSEPVCWLGRRGDALEPTGKLSQTWLWTRCHCGPGVTMDGEQGVGRARPAVATRAAGPREVAVHLISALRGLH